MRRYLLPLAALPTLALALGCDDHQAPTAPVDPAAPSFRAERLPAFNTFELGGFPSNPLAVLGGYEAGVTAEDVCANPGDRILFEGQKGQDVFTPPGGFHEHVSAVDVNLVVYEFAEGPISGPCQLPGAPVVGTGTGKFTENTQFLSSGTVVIHFTVHGTIDLVSGGQARLFATARVVIRPDGTLQFDEERVILTPL
jgi:hypothetical protein